MEKDRMKEAYESTFKIVTKLINGWDPANLFPSAPHDEYELEVSRIIASLRRVNNYLDLAKEIQVVFNKAFDWELTIDNCTSIAKEIWENTSYLRKFLIGRNET
ncbi:DUF1871 family protein [Desulforamulus aquiferis]|uniref:DUF1871 family protein n=1 Tax=Desulforamulus aquiferis TaxID=1397668 RepID=A0AAW7ZBA2_9FIRM|nr:DUF1871 family protein [Desulforamulus aquiferis]MDO7786534.1 DUF1871 family protein [Desulforamulus aquiferis]